MTTPRLRFRADGTFRILQLTDLHLQEVKSELNQQTIELVRDLIRRETPDLIAFTGDVSCDGDPEKMLARLAELLEAVEPLGIPYTYTLGNHESDNMDVLDRPSILADYLTKRPLCLLDPGDRSLGMGNYMVPVYHSDCDRMAWALYHVDCHSSKHLYEFRPGEPINWDAAVTHAQIDWLKRTHRKLQETYGVLPSILFDHVPLPEYNDVWMFDGVYGDRGEKVCCAPVNTGLFEALTELRDFRGVFCGHDHSNSYAGTMLGILLAYGRCTGNLQWCLWPKDHALQCEAERQPLTGERKYDYFKRGGRVIVLDENSGRIADTYNALEGGDIDRGEFARPPFERFDFFDVDATAFPRSAQ